MAFSAYVVVSNKTSSEIKDVQVLLDNNNDQVQLLDFGGVPKNKTSTIRHGIFVHPSNSDKWTITFKNASGEILQVDRVDFGVKRGDSGRNIEINFLGSNKIEFKRQGKTKTETASKP